MAVLERQRKLQMTYFIIYCLLAGVARIAEADMSTSSEWTASISEVSMTTSPSPSMMSLSQLCYSIFQTHSIQTNHSSLGLLLSTAIS
ncbi:hypothetical protein P5673_008365, partial [Acropora cervicornis]